MTNKEIRAKLADIADTVSMKDGVFTVRKGFFYTHGATSADLEKRVLSVLPTATIIDQGEKWAAFRGGASVAQGSHWWVKLMVKG